MSDVPMPRDLSEEAVAEWLYVNSDPFNESRVPWGGLYDGERNKWRFLARAVRALLREKVREAVRLACEVPADEMSNDAIVSRVLGDHPSNASGGSEPREGREEAPRA